MSFTTLLSTSIPSLPNDVTLITTTINISTSVSGILGILGIESTELVTSVITSTLPFSSVSSSGPTTGFARANHTTVATTTSIVAAETTTTTTTTTTTSSSSSILQPLSINTLTETDPPPVASSFTISPFSNSSIIETFPTSSTEESSSIAITEISQSSYSGKPSQTVSTSVDPSNTSQATGTSFQTTINRSHLLSVLLPTLIMGLFIACLILWILYYRCKPLSQSRHRLCITSYPLLIQRTQDNRHKADSNSCNCDAQGYNLKDVPTNILIDGESSRSPLTTSSHSQFMMEGLRRQNGSSMTLFNTFIGLASMRRNQNDGNKNSVGQSINNVGSARVDIAEDPELDNEIRHRPDMEYSTLRESVYGSLLSPVYMDLVYSRDHLDGIPESPPSYQELAHCDHPVVET